MTCPPKPGQHQATTDQLGGGHDVGVGDPPGDRPVRLDREGLDLGLDQDVGQPGRSEEGDQRAGRAVIPAQPRRSRVEPEGVEPVGDDQQAGRVPVQRARLVVDERREPRGPRSARPFEAQFGPAQGVRVGGDGRAEVDQVAARLGQREDRRSRTAAAPPPARPQAARIDDRRVARLGVSPVGRLALADATGSGSGGSSSAIGATVALDRIRRVAGGTGKTVVGSPAAAHTTG